MRHLSGDNLNTLRNALEGGINLFAGAGFSLLATDLTGEPLPLASKFFDELRAQFPDVDSANLTLAQLCTVLEKTRLDDFLTFVRRRFKVKHIDPRYVHLQRVRIRSIFTTNVDDLFLRIYEDSEHWYLNDLDLRGPTSSDRKAIDTVWLHGCVRNPNRRLDFSTTGIASTFRADLDRWHYLTGRLQKHPTLFLGYSLQDSSTLEALSPTATSGRPHADKWILLRPEEQSDAANSYFRALGFQLLYGNTESFLNYLGELPDIAQLPANREETPTPILFPQEAIPALGSVPDRPLLDFYSGSPPVWADIFSGHLHETEHVQRVKDSLLGKTNTIVIGVPACGKSTVLMQVANQIQVPGHKLVVNSLSIEKAHNIASRLNGAPASVFVDQCCDDAEALRFLCSIPSVTVAGFDSEYNFEIVSHLFDLAKLKVVPITNLSDYDIQALINKIPREISADQKSHPETIGNERPSLFEVLDQNIRGARLHDRYLEAIKKLEVSDENALDLLLINCYVHSCRTAVSLDMLLAYFGQELSYQDVYKLRQRLGALLSDVSDPSAEDNQDYYLPRSASVSQAVMAKIPQPHLKRLMVNFHERVSPFRIARYDIFKRQAYDNKLTARAFENVEEGVRFYEEVYQRTNNPYLLQHGALYLSKKHRHSDAFRWIDLAMTETAGRNFTIRNSHARILFQANITRDANDSLVQSTLHKSMEILTQCHRSDRRKAFHALTFADQTLQLERVYGNETTGRYLVDAAAWLNEEATKAPWNRNVQRMLSVVNKRLQ